MGKSTMQSIFYWILWTIGICGLMTILYGYYTHELDSHNPFFISLLAFFFALAPLVVLRD